MWNSPGHCLAAGIVDEPFVRKTTFRDHDAILLHTVHAQVELDHLWTRSRPREPGWNVTVDETYHEVRCP